MVGKSYLEDDYRRKAVISRVNAFFGAMDLHNDDYLTLDEFKEAVQYDPAILKDLDWKVWHPIKILDWT